MNADQYLTPGNVTLCLSSVLVFLLQGCATLNREECQVADWRLIGYQDGAAGLPAARVGEYREACAEYAIVPDLDAYQAGRLEGLQEYCTPDNAYRIGESGHAYAGICPAALDGRFRRAWAAGHEVHLARSRVRATHSRIDSRQQALASVKEQQRQKEVALIQDGITSEQRALLLYQLHELHEEAGGLLDEISSLEHDLAHQRKQLDHLVQNRAY
jgi:hypothetical protein